ncbi:flavodoxin domain-containing protein [Streptomyces chilikensis]|uniref:flavodoxin domain-containing protein n=1 Tax=Streptomyces chilikensis TaxID=1194079 RepID=UPI000A6952A7|nr:flavodoxin domain-containing protein [Streptomyces chilikensis]
MSDDSARPRVLIAHATAHGSTLGIAERVADILRRRGAQVEVRPCDDVADVHPYDAVVLGSAVHDMAWLPEALDLVRRERDALREHPVWIFSVGMPGALRGPWKLLAGREEPKVAGPALRELRPRDHRLFSGVIRPEHLPPGGRVSLRAMGLRYGDHRDWEAVDDWARRIADDLTRGGTGD